MQFSNPAKTEEDLRFLEFSFSSQVLCFSNSSYISLCFSEICSVSLTQCYFHSLFVFPLSVQPSERAFGQSLGDCMAYLRCLLPLRIRILCCLLSNTCNIYEKYMHIYILLYESDSFIYLVFLFLTMRELIRYQLLCQETMKTFHMHTSNY